jgi:SAM-dependent methyltransferase
MAESRPLTTRAGATMIKPATIRGLLPPLLLGPIRRIVRAVSIGRYQYGRKVPLTLGYGAYKAREIDAILRSPERMQPFLRQEALPDGYGRLLDERIAEYPWCFARIPAGRAAILDAGSILNQEYLLDQPLLRNKQLTILTLAPEDECHWQRGISYLYGDLRDIPARDGQFDTIVCLSTLEHVGCDNSAYTGDATQAEHRPDDFRGVMAELRRVLATGGTLLLSVPYGKYAHLGSFQQFDAALLGQAIEAFGPATASITYYRYTAAGWRIATAEECRDAEYVAWRMQNPLPSPLPVEPDRAVAARAVACVELRRNA